MLQDRLSSTRCMLTHALPNTRRQHDPGRYDPATP
jgi:hypothetical protein